VGRQLTGSQARRVRSAEYNPMSCKLYSVTHGVKVRCIWAVFA